MQQWNDGLIIEPNGRSLSPLARFIRSLFFIPVRAGSYYSKEGEVKIMKKISVIIVVLGIVALSLFAGCQKQEAPKSAAPASAPTSTPTGTAVTAPTATAPAK